MIDERPSRFDVGTIGLITAERDGYFGGPPAIYCSHGEILV